MVMMYGYCYEGGHLGVIYEFNAMDTVYNLLPKDSFSWVKRIKVTLGVARLLKFFHAGNPLYKPFMVRNLDAAHIMIDKDYNPKLCDFGMITDGFFADRTGYKTQYVHQCYGYDDPADGLKLTSLAIRCVETLPEDRPSMKHVVKCLMKLEIGQRHALIFF